MPLPAPPPPRCVCGKWLPAVPPRLPMLCTRPKRPRPPRTPRSRRNGPVTRPRRPWEKADEAAQSAAENKEAAEKAAEEAKAAQEAAEAAEAAADASAAEAARNAAEQSNREAAASAAQAADYAKQMAETYAEIVAIKAEMVEYLAQAQKAAEDAEAPKAAEGPEEGGRGAEAQEAALTAAISTTPSSSWWALMCPDYTPSRWSRWMPPRPRPDRPWKLPRRWKKSRLPWLQPREAIQAAGELVCASDLFRDVSLDAWYHKGVDFVVRSNYMEGMGNGVFGERSHHPWPDCHHPLPDGGRARVDGLEKCLYRCEGRQVLHRGCSLGRIPGHCGGQRRRHLQAGSCHHPGAVGCNSVPLRRGAGRGRGCPVRLL